MTIAEQQIWDCRIHALNQIGVGMPERVELAGLPIEPAVIFAVGREAARQSVGPAELVERLRAAVPRESSQDGAEVPGEQLDNAATNGAVTGNAKRVKPGTGTSESRGRTEAKPERRKRKTCTVRKGIALMNVVHAKAEEP